MERRASSPIRHPVCVAVVGGARPKCPANNSLGRIESMFVMNKTNIFIIVALGFVLPVCAQTTVSKKALEIQKSTIVIDTHADTPQRFLDENYDIGSTDPKDHGHISLDKAKAGSLGAEFFSIWVEPETNQGHYARHTLDLIDSVYEQAARHPDRMMMAFSVADIETRSP
jgi:hypothetical protein